MKLLALAFAIVIFLPASVRAADLPTPPSSFSKAKTVASKIYADHTTTFYCACAYTPNARGSGGKVDAKSCGLQPRKNAKRATRTEWEHIVPAYQFGHTRTCWSEGHSECVKKKTGKPYKGRKCCGKVDAVFRAMEADLQNLVPAVGELNGDRSNYRFDEIPGEARVYGECDFEVNSKKKIAEAPEGQRGNIARAYLYMHTVWGMPLEPERKAMYEAWHDADPLTEWEVERNKRIMEIQGVGNSFVQ